MNKTCAAVICLVMVSPSLFASELSKDDLQFCAQADEALRDGLRRSFAELEAFAQSPEFANFQKMVVQESFMHRMVAEEFNRRQSSDFGAYDKAQTGADQTFEQVHDSNSQEFERMLVDVKSTQENYQLGTTIISELFDLEAEKERGRIADSCLESYVKAPLRSARKFFQRRAKSVGYDSLAHVGAAVVAGALRVLPGKPDQFFDTCRHAPPPFGGFDRCWYHPVSFVVDQLERAARLQESSGKEESRD